MIYFCCITLPSTKHLMKLLGGGTAQESSTTRNRCKQRGSALGAGLAGVEVVERRVCYERPSGGQKSYLQRYIRTLELSAEPHLRISTWASDEPSRFVRSTLPPRFLVGSPSTRVHPTARSTTGLNSCRDSFTPLLAARFTELQLAAARGELAPLLCALRLKL